MKCIPKVYTLLLGYTSILIHSRFLDDMVAWKRQALLIITSLVRSDENKMLFGIICLLAACSDVRTPKHTHAEDYCADSETARLFRRSKWTGLDNDLKIILMLDGQDFEIYGAFDEDKMAFMNMRSIYRYIADIQWHNIYDYHSVYNDFDECVLTKMCK